MASPLRSLVKDTAWYGVSTIAGRLLNWLLVPFYVRVLASTGEYGIVTNLYAWTAFLLVILTYGMETGFFRFVNNTPNPQMVYRTCLRALAITSMLFAALAIVFSQPLSDWLIGEEMPGALVMMALIIASDAFMSIPYAYLRYKKRAVRFALIKLLFVAVNIALNLFFLLLCPYLHEVAPASVAWFYQPNFGVGYIFLSNLLANAVVFAMLLPAMRTGKVPFSLSLLKQILRYSLPLLLLGIAGIFNQMADKILFPFLYSDKKEALSQLGIYGGCFKIAVVMLLFTQAFRYAFEPFFFERDAGENADANRRRNLATVMKYFWLFMLFIFLAVMAFIDLLKYFVVEEYYAGLSVVPWVMWGEMMIGVALNLSTWYKLTNRTGMGAIVSGIGCIVGVLLIILGVPHHGFMACAWAIAASNTLIVLLNYIIGRRYYAVPYDLGSGLRYFLLAAIGHTIIFYANRFAPDIGIWRWVVNIGVLALFAAIAFTSEEPLRLVLSKITKHTKRDAR